LLFAFIFIGHIDTLLPLPHGHIFAIDSPLRHFIICVIDYFIINITLRFRYCWLLLSLLCRCSLCYAADFLTLILPFAIDRLIIVIAGLADIGHWPAIDILLPGL